MSSSISQYPTFSCQQLVRWYYHGWMMFGWKSIGKWQYLQHCKFIIPQKFDKELQVNLSFTWYLEFTTFPPPQWMSLCWHHGSLAGSTNLIQCGATFNAYYFTHGPFRLIPLKWALSRSQFLLGFLVWLMMALTISFSYAYKLELIRSQIPSSTHVNI